MSIVTYRRCLTPGCNGNAQAGDQTFCDGCCRPATAGPGTPTRAPMVCDHPGCTNNATSETSRGSYCSQHVPTGRWKVDFNRTFGEDMDAALDPLTWLDPQGDIEKIVREANTPGEPKPTCKDHPGDYGTNCPACEADKAAYRKFQQAKGGES